MEEEQLEFPKTAAEKKMHLHLSNGSQQSRRRLAWQHLISYLLYVFALGSVSPCAKTYNKYDIIDVFPWLELSKDCFSKSHTRRIPADSDKAFDEIKFLNIVGMAVENVLMGFLPVEESLNRAQKLIDEEINK